MNWDAFEKYFQMFMEALYKLLAALKIDFLYPIDVVDGEYVKATTESK